MSSSQLFLLCCGLLKVLHQAGVCVFVCVCVCARAAGGGGGGGYEDVV